MSIMLQDSYGLMHAVHNEEEIRQLCAFWRYVENWQVRVACLPESPAHEVLDLWGRNPGTRMADLYTEERNAFVTCLECVSAINMRRR